MESRKKLGMLIQWNGRNCGYRSRKMNLVFVSKRTICFFFFVIFRWGERKNLMMRFLAILCDESLEIMLVP